MKEEANQRGTEPLDSEDLEALHHALSVEGDAVQLYKLAAELTPSSIGRDAFLYLAEQEQKHLDVLEAEIRRSSEEPFPTSDAVGSDLESFTPPDDALGAVTMAIDEEQDSQSLFENLKERSKTPHVRQLFDHLAADEDRHLTILKEMQEVIRSDRLSQFNFDPFAYGENPLDRVEEEGSESRFAKHLESLGLRMTAERQKILSEVSSMVGHFDVESLCSRMREKGLTVSRATAYRTLSLLVKCGLVRRMWMGEDRILYESPYARQELPRGVGKRHGHLICETCGKVEEFFDETVDAHLEAISWRSSFISSDRSLQVFGLCENCREAAKN